MADDPDLNVKLPVKDATCPDEYKPDHPCKNGGKCYYSAVEPNRYMSHISGILNGHNKGNPITLADKVTKITTIIIDLVPPH